jgi:tetratricopeptide (TPR) repeat protein
MRKQSSIKGDLIVQHTFHNQTIRAVITGVLRFVVTVCFVLSAYALSNAQNKDKDPLERVITELQAGRMEQAFAALDEVIKQNPKNPDAYLLRGSFKMQADPEQALGDFSKVIELKPDSGVAYNQRAILLLTKGDIDAALKDLDSAIAHNFKDDSVYYLRSQLRGQVGELNGALSDIDEAIKLNPNNPRTYSHRGELLLVLKEPERALADFNYLLTWYETDPSARQVPKSVGATSQSAKNDSQTLTIGIQQQTSNEAPGAKKMAPTIARTYVNRSVILSDRGNHVAARADLDKAIHIDSNDVRALYLRAIEYEYTGDLPAALADVEKGIKLDPKHGNLRVERGVILLLLGREKEAQADFDVLLKSDQALWQKRIDERTAAVKKIFPNK